MLTYVIGSGPSGVSVSKALLSQGNSVVMLDYGNTLSAKRKQEVDLIADTTEWNKQLLDKIKYPITSDLPVKLAFGDDYPYRDGLTLLGIHLKNCGLHPSLATGGLSNVWGASIMPYTDADLKEWPICINDLAPHYTAIAEFMQIAAKTDDLTQHYPLYGAHSSPKISLQAQQLHDQMQQKKSYCQKQGIIHGYSRNAYISSTCKECSLCMWGCPYHLIYNSQQTLKELIDHPNFTYVSDTLVNQFTESDSQVTIKATSREGKELSFTADKLFLAGGVLPTAKLVLTSLNYRQPVSLKESPYFIAPLLNYKLKGDDVTQAKQNTLSQLFIEINDDALSKHTVHLQVYPYNDMLLRAIKSKFGKLFYLLFPIIKLFLNKMVIIQGYFHSTEGQDLKIQLLDSGEMQVTGFNHHVDKKIKHVMRKLKKFGIAPLFKKSIPGRSFHCGGTFPMVAAPEKQPNTITVNSAGLLTNTNHVHIVDASILPTIPAQTITYTVMANAHRIGSLFKATNI